MEVEKKQFGLSADRPALLMQAADQLDALQNVQSGGKRKAKASPAAKRIRSLADDEGKFADIPQVIPITDKAYIAAKLPIPSSAEKMFEQYRFYLLQFAFDLRPAKGWAFDALTVQVEFNPEARTGRPKVYALFPESKFSDILKLGGKIEAGIGAGLQFEAGLTPKQVQGSAGSLKVGGSVKNTEAAEVNFLAGPFTWNWKRMLVKSSQPGLEWARWELDGSEFNQGNSPGLMLVAQVPSDAKSVRLRGQLEAKRDFSLLDYGIRNAITHIDEALQRFIKGGAPYAPQPVDWDLTRKMGLSGE